MRTHLLLAAVPLLLSACGGNLTGGTVVPEQIQETPAEKLMNPGIVVTEPFPDVQSVSPIAVRGRADASWFREDATFPARLQDEAGNVLVDLYATALSYIGPEGMTEFETFLDITGLPSGRAFIVLERGNVPADPSAAASVIIPVMLP